MSVDSRGISRGSCESCGCDGYDGGDKQRKCLNCGHPPGKHENLDTQTAATSTPPVPSTSTLPAAPTPQSSTSAGSAYARFTGFFTKMFSPHPAQPHQSTAPIDGFKVTPATGCAVLGCGRPVEFDANTGKEYVYCGEHIGSAAASLPLSGCVQMGQDGNGCGGTGMFIPGGQQHDTGTLVDSTTGVFNTPNPFSSVPPGTPKCALPNCYNPPYVDENGTVYKCCGRTHAREFEALSTATAIPPPLSASLGPPPPGPVPPISSGGLPPDKKCAIVECQNPRFVDDSGTVHECCGITHAMEHQRRLALMKQTNQQVIKGVTHCYLPECNRPTWPFMNYCGRTHAQQGQQRGLSPPSLTSGPAAGSGAAAASAAPKTSSMCLIPECQQPKYVDPKSGVTHDFCGKSHADEGRRRGIRPQADKPEDECDLPGCTSKKKTEGTRVHDYCCRDHASQDAPNLAARFLTSHAEVQKFLQKFSNLTVVSLDENSHAKPGGQLFNKFKNAFNNLPKQHRKTCLAFHGTQEKNIQSICSNGYDPKLRSGQAYGAGEYFATKPNIPLSYCHGGKKMLLNELLLGQSGTHHTQHGDIVVMKNPDHDLPRYVITFS